MWDLYPAPVFGHVMPLLSLVASPVSLCPEASLVSSKTLKILDPAGVLGVWVLQLEKSESGAIQKLWGRENGSEKREVYLWIYFFAEERAITVFRGETREIWPTVKKEKEKNPSRLSNRIEKIESSTGCKEIAVSTLWRLCIVLRRYLLEWAC